MTTNPLTNMTPSHAALNHGDTEVKPRPVPSSALADRSVPETELPAVSRRGVTQAAAPVTPACDTRLDERTEISAS
jgi:hypothetical protein